MKMILLAPIALLAACESGTEQAEERLETAAEASAAAAGPAPAALGLSEAQLIDADLRGAGGIELGSVEAVRRDAQGAVDRLVIEIEDSHPDRFVEVPLAGLTPALRGDDVDLSTSMTREQLAALPDAAL